MFNKLKSLKNLAPDPEFLRRSRQTILLSPGISPPARFHPSWYFAAALGLAAVFLYIATSAGGSSAKIMVQKENSPDFNIELRNARYYKEIAPNVYVVVLEGKK